MNHLTDMEELIGSIKSPKIADYMTEAMTCYMSNAYRACIVLSYIALFHDIVSKLKELGKVNSVAATIYQEAKSRIDDQKIYESYLIDQLRSNSLIPSVDTSFLNILRTLRNKSSHPSGHSPSAEEARFVFYETIHRFLCKDILTTTQLVDDIIQRINDSYFFPTVSIDDTETIVNKECLKLHPKAYPYLINKLLPLSIAIESDLQKNSMFFLNGIVRNADEEITEHVVKYIFDNKSSDERYSDLIINQLCANGNIISKLSPITISRVKIIIEKCVKDTEFYIEHSRYNHPSCMFVSILMSVGEDKLLELFNDELDLFLNIFSNSPYFLSHIIGFNKIESIYIQKILTLAGSNDFDTANLFARTAHSLEENIVKIITDEDALKLIFMVIKAANNNAWGARDLCTGKFESINSIRFKAENFLHHHEDISRQICTDILGHYTSLEDTVKQYIEMEE